MTKFAYLSKAEKKFLLQISRETLTDYLAKKPIPTYTVTNPNLKEICSVFVTLWQQNRQLRGCVGRINPKTQLYQTVQSSTINAATKDTRFSPTQAEELDNLIIEISVLSPMQKISSPKEIEIGRHGLYIQQENPTFQSGLLLPEVASKRSWNQQQFLQAVSRKANLPINAWEVANLYRFETEIFEEEFGV